ncbi:pimeloyl-ACP methyl ester carboxylesterase [Nitrospirillum amazonense]|uniref:Pimeloyl-ACP methyl ester carboxylesterase n=1 Tax=Nitrospirillum amazonense TaxID=28077 RepID=A0A560EWX6_9PROT|nr:alpha/beta hydrolase [Nitrospirillum amazonense]TWB13879.1 pimeloyl-ACP methyl ester carboxylesterase [Nitrospirillum amazonense]
MNGPVSRFYFSDRLRLHYVEWGREDKPTLLLVHGGRDHCRSWDWVAQDLARDFHILAPDLRGHGDSAWTQGGAYTLAEVVADLVQLLRQRAGRKVVVMGHSYGGAAALFLASLYPELVERLAVVEGTWPWQELRTQKPLADRFRAWVDKVHELSARGPRKYQTLEEAVARMQAENGFLSTDQAHHLTVHGLHQNEDGTYSWKFDNYIRTAYPFRISLDELRDLWSAVSCPTLLINGGKSWVEDPVANGAAALFPQGRTAMIADAGHWPHHDRLDTFMAITRPFLAG